MVLVFTTWSPLTILRIHSSLDVRVAVGTRISTVYPYPSRYCCLIPARLCTTVFSPVLLWYSLRHGQLDHTSVCDYMWLCVTMWLSGGGRGGGGWSLSCCPLHHSAVVFSPRSQLPLSVPGTCCPTSPASQSAPTRTRRWPIRGSPDSVSTALCVVCWQVVCRREDASTCHTTRHVLTAPHHVKIPVKLHSN